MVTEPLTKEFVEQSIAKAKELFNKNCKHESYKKALESLNLKVILTNRLRVTAGRASRKLINPAIKDSFIYTIELSKVVLSKTTKEEQYDTISHELAHLLDAAIRNKFNHDKFWKSLHVAMGGTGKRCHGIEVKRNKRRKVKVTNLITKQEFFISPKSYKKLKFNLSLDNAAYMAEHGIQKFKIEDVIVGG
jgi:hypothetical protein